MAHISYEPKGVIIDSTYVDTFFVGIDTICIVIGIDNETKYLIVDPIGNRMVEISGDHLFGDKPKKVEEKKGKWCNSCT